MLPNVQIIIENRERLSVKSKKQGCQNRKIPVAKRLFRGRSGLFGGIFCVVLL